ncbi:MULTISPECIES: vanadium-dependent haloperoxidase [Flavobacteriaceae]|uniref:vanadium-dependent haloperoxidase n=1 Tax=Flavobacteriaceae TaxID=49546 RepID=UPI0014932007|nr:MULTISPECIES: vanadium-dependent haloperoxidase [Allomuricauda]MDC6365891.1 vanadium-dependent haloperoxidase [Muricauda sp. AC10]
MYIPKILGGATMLFILALAGCNLNKKPISETEAAIKWAEMTNYITQFTPSNSPTFASRAYAYIALTMYESVVHGSPEYNSMAGQLNDLEKLPKPTPNKEYSWVLAMNAAQAQITKSIYQQTSDENKQKIDSLEKSLFEHFSDTISKEVANRSLQYGKKVANAIFEWSKTDGGHRGYLDNFDKNLVHPDFPGSWKPPLYAQSFSHHPLHPHWGKNRTFVKANREIPTPYMIPYDTIPGSPYYKQFLAVYKKERELTQEEKEAAIWWGDDPDVTFTPPGHSYYIATIVINKKKPDLIHTAEAYAKTALAVADSFIKCWEWKFHFFSERPNTYVPKFIDPEWESFWPDPPFPAFPSGHAIQAAASATILEDTFGKQFTFVDRAHEGRERDEVRDTDFVVRTFDSFWEFAQETADSRFYGGIHTFQDNDIGLVNGALIAKNVIALDWKKL